MRLFDTTGFLDASLESAKGGGMTDEAVEVDWVIDEAIEVDWVLLPVKIDDRGEESGEECGE